MWYLKIGIIICAVSHIYMFRTFLMGLEIKRPLPETLSLFILITFISVILGLVWFVVIPVSISHLIQLYRNKND